MEFFDADSFCKCRRNGYNIEETACFVVGFPVGRKDSLREGGHSIEEDYGALYGRLPVLPQCGAGDG